jgi:hypothetical protein
VASPRSTRWESNQAILATSSFRSLPTEKLQVKSDLSFRWSIESASSAHLTDVSYGSNRMNPLQTHGKNVENRLPAVQTAVTECACGRARGLSRVQWAARHDRA